VPRAAVSAMIELLSSRHHMNPVDAYILCSVCANLRISEIVDRPNSVVSLYFPRIVFEQSTCALPRWTQPSSIAISST